MTGFRVGLGGAQAIYNIKPDITALGKVIGGGMPVGAYGASHKIMSQLAPDGPIYQAGTLSGNPIACAAGLATLTAIEQPNFFENLSSMTQKLAVGLKERAQAAKINLATQSVGGMFGFVFSSTPQIDLFQQALEGNIEHFKRFFHGMLKQGVYLAPSAFEAGFVSSAHTDDEINKTLEAAEQVFHDLSNISKG